MIPRSSGVLLHPTSLPGPFGVGDLGPADDLNPEISPDGRWVAYQSRASGQFEIWVRPWPGDLGGATRDPGRPVTRTGGTRPAWTRNGRELLYLTHEGTFVSLPVESGAEAEGGLPAIGEPRPLFTADAVYRDLVGRTYDVTPDGERLLVILAPEIRDGSRAGP